MSGPRPVPYLLTSERLVAYCFEEGAFERVEIRADVDNHASRAVPERLGFVQEGILRASARRGGPARRDTALYALIRRDRAGS